MHWDEWIGPAPYRDYHDGLHPFSWRDWKAFGTGTIGDMACHHLAFPFMALRLWEVKKFTVECINTKNGSDEKYPQDNVVCYHIPGPRQLSRPASATSTITRIFGPQVMKELEKKYSVKWGEATLFVGTKGYLDNHSRIIPESEHKKFPVPPKTLVRRQGRRPHRGPLRLHPHRGRARLELHRRGPARLRLMALTGHLAQYAGIGSKIEWDVEKMQCTNRPES